jgi:competence protein ComEA
MTMQRILIVVAVIALVALAVWHPAPRAPSVSATPAVVDSAAHRHARLPASAATALVYVVGAVARPGLYPVASGARIDDAVRAAGGLRADADAVAVDLAAHVSDGDEIAVPALGQPMRSAPNTKRTTHSRTRSSKTRAIVDVNTASAQALASVPGIGAAIAARIVEIREQDGAYTSFDELLDVAGMTESRLARAQPYLRL